MSHSVPLTKESHEALQEELKRLIREERPKVIQDIAEARAHGDLSENAEYDAAKNRQGFIEGRIQEMQDKLARAYVVDLTKLKPDKVVFGCHGNTVRHGHRGRGYLQDRRRGRGGYQTGQDFLHIAGRQGPDRSQAG